MDLIITIVIAVALLFCAWLNDTSVKRMELMRFWATSGTFGHITNIETDRSFKMVKNVYILSSILIIFLLIAVTFPLAHLLGR